MSYKAELFKIIYEDEDKEEMELDELLGFLVDEWDAEGGAAEDAVGEGANDGHDDNDDADNEEDDDTDDDYDEDDDDDEDEDEEDISEDDEEDIAEDEDGENSKRGEQMERQSEQIPRKAALSDAPAASCSHDEESDSSTSEPARKRMKKATRRHSLDIRDVPTNLPPIPATRPTWVPSTRRRKQASCMPEPATSIQRTSLLQCPPKGLLCYIAPLTPTARQWQRQTRVSHHVWSVA